MALANSVMYHAKSAKIRLILIVLNVKIILLRNMLSIKITRNINVLKSAAVGLFFNYINIYLDHIKSNLNFLFLIVC